MRQEGEPSVEEILESIKRVIERDSVQNADRSRSDEGTRNLIVQKPDRAPEVEPEVQPEAEADTQVEAETGDDRGEGKDDLDGELDDAEEVLDLSEAGAPLENAGSDGDGSLTNEAAAAAMRQSLSALAMLSDPPARPQIVRSGETSLEGLVREMLRPMLAQWLDANLPDMVERMVKAEIARIAGKKR